MADSKKGTWKEGDLVFDKIVYNGKVVSQNKPEKKEKGKEKPKPQKK